MDILALNDVYISTMSIVESESSSKPGVLCTVEGVLMEAGKVNNNSRVYTKGLLKNKIVNNATARKLMANGTLLGEAAHPSDRFSVDIPYISHAIRDMWLSEDGSKIYGIIDILDTPNGRIIYTLVQYGSKIGVSARARGRLVTKGDVVHVDEEQYIFKTFDFVPNPGFDTARLTKVNESEQDVSLLDKLTDFVNSASVSELKSISSIFESISDESFKGIKEVLDKRLAEDTSEAVNIQESLYDENVELMGKVDALVTQLNESAEELKTLRQEVSFLREHKASLEQELNESQSTVSGLDREVSRLKNSLSKVRLEQSVTESYVDDLLGMVEFRDKEISSLNESVEESNSAINRLKVSNSHLRSSNSALREKLAEESVKQKVNIYEETIVDKAVVLNETTSKVDTSRVNFILKCGGK